MKQPMDIVVIVFTILSFVVGSIAAVAAVYAVVYSYQQLKIARGQAALRPVLVVEEVRLLDLGEVPSILEEISTVEEERREEEEEEEQRRNMAGRSEMEQMSWEMTHFRVRGLPYETYYGDLPDKVLRVRIRNDGVVTATGVEATIRVRDTHLKPLDYFLDVKEVRYHSNGEDDAYGTYAVRLGDRDLDMPPGDEHYNLLVAVVVRSSGTTPVITSLATATTSMQDIKELEI